jgi:glycosyltransferase involved in cell wall biosynthesis
MTMQARLREPPQTGREMMGASDSVSVIIPAYNAAAHVDRTIESALAQTCAPREILVIDDGSTDNTAGVVSRYPAPVRLLRQANGGPGAARNRGAREAKGEWLALLDADDVWLPHKLERQLPYTKSPATGVVHSREAVARVPAKATFAALWEGNVIHNSSALVRRTALEAVGGYDEDRALIGVEDWNLWLRLAAAKWEIVLCPEKLHHYLPAAGNLSSQTERILKADLVNVEKVGWALPLPERVIRARCAALYEECGRTYLNDRMLGDARRQFASGFRAQPSLPMAGWWLATFLPTPVLDLRRRLVHAEGSL